MTVIIGVDPHKSTHTAVAIDGDEQPLARGATGGGPLSDPAAVGLGGTAGHATDLGGRIS
jgi:hypothetical protein